MSNCIHKPGKIASDFGSAETFYNNRNKSFLCNVRYIFTSIFDATVCKKCKKTIVKLLHSACFVFRRPLLSSVKNIFELPFQQNVWKAIAVFLLVVFCLLYLSMKWEYYVYHDASTKSVIYWKQINNEPTVSDNLLILLGAVAQQGTLFVIFLNNRLIKL